MGTFLGNLQVMGASKEEVSALLPKAVVGQWSERFVTILDEGYGIGTVERPARILSKKLPGAVVLSVGLVDSDLLELAVWQDGKRQTVRAHFPYDGVSKRGDAKKFCALLRLPPEDEKRLKTVWAKGDAEEQLDLTAALLGAPLYADPELIPEQPAVRNADAVDRWLAEHPDPPKVKNQTKAELLQEIKGYTLIDEGGCIYHCDRLVRGCSSGGEDRAFQISKDGTLEEVPGLTDLIRKTWTVPDGTDTDIEKEWMSSNGRVLWVFHTREDIEDDNYIVNSVIMWDSFGKLPCPFTVNFEGRAVCLADFHAVDDGTVIFNFQQKWPMVNSETPKATSQLVCCGPDGTVRWRRDYSEWEDGILVSWIFCCGVLWNRRGNFGYDMNGNKRHLADQLGDRGRLLDVQDCRGELWAEKEFTNGEDNDQEYLVRMDREGHILRKVLVPDLIYFTSLDQIAFWKDRLVMNLYKGIYLFDRDTLAVLKRLEDNRDHINLKIDGRGRCWAQVGDSMVEAYDRDMTLLSRHRLKGTIVNWKIDPQGRLCVLTMHQGKWGNDLKFDENDDFYFPKFDPEKEVLRVYRLD